MKYWVTMAIDGRYTAEVEANDFDEAMVLARDEYMGADFGGLECIDMGFVNAESESGEFIDL